MSTVYVNRAVLIDLFNTYISHEAKRGEPE
jgi:hypothetical protein